MDAPKCRTCGERHPAGPCPQHQTKRGDRPEATVLNGAAERKKPTSKRARSPQGVKEQTGARAFHALAAGEIPAQNAPERPAEDGERAGHKTSPRRGRPRIEDRDKTLKATKPWVAAGMSERSWYRRRAEGKA